MFKGKTLAASAVAIMAVSAASAATISVETFSAAAFDAFQAGNVLGYVDFEEPDFSVGEGAFTGTAVGDFAAVPMTGTGGSVIGTGTQLAISDDEDFGRRNTTVGGSQWLDSNDNQGIAWTATLGGDIFNRLAFSLSDAADTGAELTVAADGGDLKTFISQSNATVDWIVISFGGAITSADITLTNTVSNDGFGIDDVTVAAVPLPAGAALMLTGLGGLAIARRRKAAK